MMHKKFHDYIEGDFKDKENLKRKEDKTVF